MVKGMFKVLTMAMFVVAMTLISCNSSSEKQVYEDIILRVNFGPGFYQNYQASLETSPGTSIEMSETNVVNYTFDSMNSDGYFVLTGKISRIKYKADMMGEKESYDSDNFYPVGDVDVDFMEIHNTVNKEFLLILDSFGRSIEGPTFMDASLPSTSMANYSLMVYELPQKKISVGSSWTFNKPHPLLNTKMVESTCTVTDITADYVNVDITQFMDLGIESQTIIGAFTIDRATGRVLHSAREMDLMGVDGKANLEFKELSGGY